MTIGYHPTTIKYKIYNLAIAFVLGTIGMAFMAYVDWRIAVGVFFFAWSMNLSNKTFPL